MELDYVTEENFFCGANGSLQKGTNAAPIGILTREKPLWSN